MKRKTAKKKFNAKIKAFKEWLKTQRTEKTGKILEQVKVKLRGHYAYYGVSDNSRSIRQFYIEVQKLLYKWLNRRGKRGSLTWADCKKLMAKCNLPEPRIMVKFF